MQFNSSRTSRASGRRRRLIEEIVEKILIAAVADADVTVRHSIFISLHGNRGFDDFLAQADSLTAIFTALNDEDFQVREFAISVAGRLSEKNPAYVLPALRQHLIQLLTYLEQSADSKCREESAKLLGCLIRNCERLILPYIAPVQKALVAKLCEGTGVNANNGIISGVLVTVGDLARVVSGRYVSFIQPEVFETAILEAADVLSSANLIAGAISVALALISTAAFVYSRLGSTSNRNVPVFRNQLLSNTMPTASPVLKQIHQERPPSSQNWTTEVDVMGES